MASKAQRLQADVVIAGGGPGGCMIANDLSKKGKKVVLIEQGANDTKLYGSAVGLAMGGHVEMGKRWRLRKTIERHSLVLGKGVGGGTKLYQGIAFLPNIKLFERVGIDLTPYVDEAARETWTNETPDEFLGPETRRLMETALKLGHPWKKFLKHIDFGKCKLGCNTCGNGCPIGAKWSGKVPADEAAKRGATLLTHTRVRDVIVENGVAVGVRARGRDGRAYEVYGNAVVCSAGGVGSAPILKRSGIREAGSWLVGDPSIMMWGFLREGRGPAHDLQMIVGSLDEEHGVILSAGMSAPRSGFFIMNMQKLGFRRAFRNAVRRYDKAVGVWTKVHDDEIGRVYLDGKVSKTFTAADWDRMEYAVAELEKILIAHGCNPYDIHRTGIVIGHPGGTAPIGRVVDSNLETQIKKLYCCDTSVMPEAPGRPPALTVVCLAKRLAQRLETIV